MIPTGTAPRIFLFFYLISIIFTHVFSGISHGASAELIVSDQLVRAKKESRIRVRLMGEKIPFFTRPVTGERIRFLLNQEPLGISLTGGDGIATRKIPPLREGIHRVQVELPDSSFRALPAEFLLGVWEKSAPLLLVLTPSLMMGQTAPTFPIPPLAGPPMAAALPHAAEALNELQKKWAVVYLTAGVSIPYEDQKKWLKKFAFPEAPLVRVKAGEKGLIRQIQDWKDEGWEKIQWVVTDSEGQADQLAGEGLSTILIQTDEKRGETESSSKKQEYLIAKDWNEIPPLISRGRRR